ncbi:MAG: hypothetical protein ACHQXA_04970 [Gemmatimonadales bacterium]
MSALSGPGSRADSHGDSLDRVYVVQAIGLTLVSWLFLGVLGFAGYLGPAVEVLLFLLVPLAALGISRTMHWMQSGLASAFINELFAGRGETPRRDYSLQDSYVIRGLHDRAVDSYLQHILAHPDDVEACFRLSEVHWRQRHDAVAAEEPLLDLRRRELSREESRRLARALIDLYEASTNVPRLRIELARFAKEFPGGAAAAGAMRRLKELST